MLNSILMIQRENFPALLTKASQKQLREGKDNCGHLQILVGLSWCDACIKSLIHNIAFLFILGFASSQKRPLVAIKKVS
jgi:hypothetical protein